MINLKKYSSKQLLNKLNKVEGEELKAVKDILISRGVIEPEPETTGQEPQELLQEARKNKGLKVRFLCTKTKTRVFGIIKGVRLDKRNDFIQYRIKTTNGMFGKGIHSQDLAFIS